ncbi:MaoC/PaaZ C-terminal domain-containing protein [Halobellus ordinarius]|uniref:MaoC/PaaZ C-terminal domain-containing protein n=1 Tax=Halobellus ordinarius TaxID=3075120 RepID=UPI00287FFF55|nr:MaoC/PaaZ C-terminal domain-containing protein [Halobellus sp. ZY16]
MSDHDGNAPETDISAGESETDTTAAQSETATPATESETDTTATESETDASPPAERLTYEDVDVGDRYVADGTVTFTREEIVDFAAEYDPQPFHVGDDVDDAAPFDGLVASGLHSFCVCSRLATEAFFGRIAFLGGRGVDELRWYRPIRPGDSLSVAVEIVDKRVSESDPRRGHIDVDILGRDPDGETVVRWRVLGMIRRENSA